MFSHIHFQSIPVTDPVRARDFYRDKLGFSVERDAPYGESRWIFMELPGARTLLQFDHREVVEPHDKPRLVLVTGDVDATCKALEARGVAIHMGPDDAPWEPGTRWAMIHDPDGNLILIQTVKQDQAR